MVCHDTAPCPKPWAKVPLKGSNIGVIMENQMEKNMENEMETGIIGFIGCMLGLYVGVI